jgi:hypothetical protein
LAYALIRVLFTQDQVNNDWFCLDTSAYLMNVDNQNGYLGIDALAGAIRLKARLQPARTGFDRQHSLGALPAEH